MWRYRRNDAARDTQARHVEPSPRVQRCLEDLARAVPDVKNVEVSVDKDAIRITRVSAHGPDIAILLDNGRSTLVVGPWHDDFHSVQLIYRYIQWTMDGTLRVRVDLIRGKPSAYALELLSSDGSWREDSVMTLCRPFLRRGPVSAYYIKNDGPPSLRHDFATAAERSDGKRQAAIKSTELIAID